MTQKAPISICWLRRDLRLVDNTALNKALSNPNPVLCLFIFDKHILDKLVDRDDARINFIFQTVKRLKNELKASGSDLLVKYDSPESAWKQILTEYKIDSVYANEDYEPYAHERDEKINQLLAAGGINFELSTDHCIFKPGTVVKPDGKPYTIFTPFKNKWLATFLERPQQTSTTPATLDFFQVPEPLKLPQLEEMGFTANGRNFPDIDYLGKLESYGKDRDYPGIEGTSRLGIHLRFGTVSIREILKDARKYSEVFQSELIWREFYFNIVWHFPHVAKDSFKPAYDHIGWLNNEADFSRWCQGKTGFPMVDAGMRQLNETGFMHNRLRMITASFLCKDLLIDWRWGEAYFARKLLDFELASNNGGWQWAAGSGCDAAPYFRIFNPTEQLKKFDPDLSFTRKWVPEFQQLNYTPMIDHKFARDRCLTVYKKALINPGNS